MQSVNSKLSFLSQHGSITLLDFTVPGVPVPKQRPRLARNGRVYTPARTREYEYLVGDYARAAVKTSGWLNVPGEYALQVTVYRVRRAGDLDNYLKAISDGLNGIVWPDDAMVRTLIAFADLSRDNPRADITVGRYL